ncbi:mRNA 3' end processing factor [Stygiomarasmius scandens]|uniref:mRNA 3' end processing factor n=1 Tax=Marasmiellus scandens TaxID=2682957 RepID=A0ABR1K0S6_9AGAR
MSMYQNYYAQPSYGSQTYAQPPVANGYHQFPPQASYPVDPTTFRRDFSNRLSELTMNSRPIIQSLSMYAHDYVRFAEIVAQCLETHIRRVPPWMKLPSFYLLDMISKNIFEPYARLFSTFVIPLFLETYQQVDEATRSKMVELVLTWRTGSPTGKELFGVPAQVQIERSIWGETSSSPASTSQSNGFITKSQVLSELEFTLGQKERAVQANPSDTTSQNHVHVLHQLRRLVEAGVSQEELKQILSQLRNLMRSSVTPTISQPSQVAPTSTSQWPSQSYTAPQTSLPPAATYPYAYPAIKTEDAVPSKPILPISSVPAVPAGGFANLLSSLVKSGILSNTGTPLGAGATAKDESSNSVDEEREASRTHRAFVLRHPVQLSTAGITKGRPPISEMLYDHLASQCKQCGLRFPDTVSGKKLLEDHLDMHFKQNMKANLNIGRGHSRSWYTSVDDWVHDTTDRKGKGRADGSRPLSGKAAAAADAAKRDAELRAQFVIVPPGDEAKPISCPICKEALKSEFLEDDEEWVWRNAIKKDERIYHATCHAEASTNTLASRLLNTGRSRSITPEAQVLAVKKSSPSPESLAGVKRKAGDDHSPLSQFEGTPPSKKLAISA